MSSALQPDQLQDSEDDDENLILIPKEILTGSIIEQIQTQKYQAKAEKTIEENSRQKQQDNPYPGDGVLGFHNSKGNINCVL